MNIILNAVKFTKEGGIEIYINFEKSVECHNVECGELITIVKDTGIGMDEDTYKNLF